MVASCKAQNKLDVIANNDQEVLVAFFNQMEMFSYLDKNVSGKNNIELFAGKYRHHRGFFKNSDSICKNSKDIERLKISCPLADAFKMYDTLLSDNDLGYLIDLYKGNSRNDTLNLENILSKTSLQQHSDKYYQEVEYDQYGGIPDLDEFPSIRIENLYYNQEKSVAIVAYSIVLGPRQTESNFYMFKMMDGVWWKPMGAFKI